MTAKYPGAGHVVQESLGHGVTFTAPSNCTDEWVREYFDTGAVPDGETSCDQNCGPWDTGCTVSKVPALISAGKRSLHSLSGSFVPRMPISPGRLF